MRRNGTYPLETYHISWYWEKKIALAFHSYLPPKRIMLMKCHIFSLLQKIYNPNAFPSSSIPRCSNNCYYYLSMMMMIWCFTSLSLIFKGDYERLYAMKYHITCKSPAYVLVVVQGPVVQSIISLTSLLVVKMLITILVSKISNSQEFLLKKMWETFATIFSAKILVYMPYLMINVLTIR